MSEASGVRLVSQKEINDAVKELIDSGHAYFADKVVAKFDVAPCVSFAKPTDRAIDGDLYVVKYSASGAFDTDVPAGTKAILAEL